MAQTTQNVDDLFKEAAPEIGLPLSTIVELQRGLPDPASGEWQTTAEVRELTGADEEYLASLEAKTNVSYAEYMTALLKRAVVRIGSIDVSEHPDAVDNLIIGDRDTLFLGIVKCTYGVEREYTARCTTCEEKSDVVVNMDEDFPIQETSSDLHSPVTVKLRNGKVAKLRLPNGADSIFVGKASSTTAAQNTLMLARCVLPDSDVLEGRTPEAWAKSLGMADRAKLVKALLEVKVGPKLEGVNVQCAHCGAEMILSLNWMSLLFG